MRLWSVTALPLLCCYSARVMAARLSVRVMVIRPSLVYHWSITDLWLVFLLRSWPLVRVADRASLVRHSSACSSFCWSAARPSLVMAVALPVALPLLRLLVCLLARRFPVARLSAGPSLLVRR